MNSQSLEARFFRTLNRFIEPVVRVGFGSPWIWPTGLVVIECTGRRTGGKHRVPVTATVVGHQLIIASTMRPARSQWLKNLAAVPELTYWLAGREHTAKAIVFTPGAPTPDVSDLPALLRSLVPFLSWWTGFGIGFAVLAPVKGSTPDG